MEYQPKIVMLENIHVQQKLKPLEIVKYNELMSGVNRSDQMKSY